MPNTLLQLGNVFESSFPPLFCSALGLILTSHKPTSGIAKGRNETKAKSREFEKINEMSTSFFDLQIFLLVNIVCKILKQISLMSN
jgi:precorrin-4 methylase